MVAVSDMARETACFPGASLGKETHRASELQRERTPSALSTSPEPQARRVPRGLTNEGLWESKLVVSTQKGENLCAL